MRVPSGRAHDRRDSQPDQAAQVFNRGLGRRKLYRHVNAFQVFRRQPFAVRVIVDVEARNDLVPARGGDALDHPPHLAVTYDCDPHCVPPHATAWARAAGSNVSSSSSLKNSRCSDLTAPSTPAPSTMKLTLIAEAPCEIIETLICSMLEKIREATPGVNFRFSPIRQINAASRSTETSPRDCRSAAIASRRRVSSIVIETLTSEVATMSTEVSCLSKTAKRRERNPWAISIRSDVTLMTVIPRLNAMALTTARDGGALRTIAVPAASGRLELQTRAGMPLAIAGSSVLGCRTFAPK